MEKFTEVVNLRFTKVQKQKIIHIAALKNKNVSTFTRDIIQEFLIDQYENKNWKIDINQLNLLK